MITLKSIRERKYVEPLNSGENHPTVLYIPIGHGGETIGDKRVVPKGCILAVKAHSGDFTKNTDLVKNVSAILNPENKEAIFDPISHKKDLYRILTDSGNHSTAIYREGDTYNNFVYQMVNVFPSQILTSGIYTHDYNSANSEYNILRRNALQKRDSFVTGMPVFIKYGKKYMYNSMLLDIPSYFQYSDAYPYYYTRQHIQDILDIILIYINLYANGYIDINTVERMLIENTDGKYLKIKKGATYNLAGIILGNGITPVCRKSVGNSDITAFRAINTKSKNLQADPRMKWIECLRVMTIDQLLVILVALTTTTQADLFKDVTDGILRPGIFYNLICRESENTSKVTHLLNVSRSNKKVKNQIGEIKNRISESILQRKNQIRQVYKNSAGGTRKCYRK